MLNHCPIAKRDTEKKESETVTKETKREKNFKALMKYSKADLAIYLLCKEFIDFSILDEIRKDWKDDLRKRHKKKVKP